MKSQHRAGPSMAEPPGKSNNLTLCFSKMKFPNCAESPPSPPPSSAAATAPTTTTTTAAAAAIFKNFNSLFDSTTSKSLSPSTSSSHSHSDSTSGEGDELPDLTSAYASRRFFFSSPGRSNSITDSASRGPDPVVGGSVAVPTYSPDPYADFRRSMQEMVDARQLLDVKSNWEYLHELLLCYLALNPKNTHKFIVGAFADLLVSLMPDGTGGCGGGNHHRRPPPR